MAFLNQINAQDCFVLVENNNKTSFDVPSQQAGTDFDFLFYIRSYGSGSSSTVSYSLAYNSGQGYITSISSPQFSSNSFVMPNNVSYTIEVKGKYPSSASGATLTFTYYNPCGGGNFLLSIGLNFTPPAPTFPSIGTISGPSILCKNSSGTYSVNSISGATYHWTTAGFSGSSSTNSILLTHQNAAVNAVSVYYTMGSYTSPTVTMNVEGRALATIYGPDNTKPSSQQNLIIPAGTIANFSCYTTCPASVYSWALKDVNGNLVLSGTSSGFTIQSVKSSGLKSESVQNSSLEPDSTIRGNNSLKNAIGGGGSLTAYILFASADGNSATNVLLHTPTYFIIPELLSGKVNQDSQEKKMTFDVYPNPSSGIINLNINNPSKSKEVKIEVFNSEGLLVYVENLEGFDYGIKTIDLSKATKGLYFIKLTSQDNKIERKVILK